MTAAREHGALGALIVAALLGASFGVPAPALAQSLPDSVVIREPGLHPEGVEWDAERGRFLVTSVTRGTVTAVGDDGSHETLIEDPDLSAAIGIHLDARRGRILVANSDFGVFEGEKGSAALGIYDAATGERLHMVDLGGLYPEGRHFANDVTVAPDGTAYVTDSFSPVIYEVTPEGEASILVRDSLLTHEQFGLNGIDYIHGDVLIAAVAGRGTLVRIPLDAPESLEPVRTAEPVAADGLTFLRDGSLVAVAAGRGEGQPTESFLLRSGDGWESAHVVGRAETGGATTAAARDREVYVVNPRFEGMGGDSPVETFEIFRVRFEGTGEEDE